MLITNLNCNTQLAKGTFVHGTPFLAPLGALYIYSIVSLYTHAIPIRHINRALTGLAAFWAFQNAGKDFDFYTSPSPPPHPRLGKAEFKSGKL